jgi:hypothetical protein
MQVPARPLKRQRRRPALYAEQDGVGKRRAEATATETDICASAPQPQGTITTDSAPKRKWGIRKPNKYPKGVTFVVTRVGDDGQILEPRKYNAKFRNACGALVRDQLNPAIRSWSGKHGVPEKKKIELWEDWLMVTFKLPEGTHERVQKHAFKIMGSAFQRWRCALNKRFIQTGQTPFVEFGNISQNQWQQLVAEKTSPEAMLISARNREQAKKNQHRPHLGPGGYLAKQGVFRMLDELAETSGDPKKRKVKDLKQRLKQWIYARSVDSSDLKFAEQGTEEVVSKILKNVEDVENGTFTPSRERDELSLALGNPEHTGRTRGLGKTVTWKQGFVEDSHMYNKRGRNREANLEATVAALVAKELAKHGLNTESQTPMEPVGESALVPRPLGVTSSQASTAHDITDVDRIRVPTSCTLLVPMGRGTKVVMAQAAMGVAHPPGGVWHCRPIPEDFTRVEVHTVKPNFMTWEIEHPTPEGLVQLGEVMNQFILWHKKDIAVHEQAGDNRTPNLTHSSPTPSEHATQPQTYPAGLIEQGHDGMPQHSPARHNQQVHDEMPQLSPGHHIEQVHDEVQHPCPTEQGPDVQQHKQGLPSKKEDEGAHVSEAQKKPPETSRLHQEVQKYPNAADIKWNTDIRKKYKKGKNFLRNQVMKLMPIGMKKFHDWYLRAHWYPDLNQIKAVFPKGTFGGAAGDLMFDFADMQECFRLGMMEMNLVRLWCL